MIKKQQQFLIKGMNQDIAETKVQSGLAHSIKNLRVITDEDSGTLSLVTEKGTNKINLPTSFNLIKNQSSYEAFAGQTAYTNYWSEQQTVNFDTSGSTSIALVCRLRVYSISCSYNFPRNVYVNSYSDVNIPKCVMIIGTSPYIKIPASSTTNGYTLELRLNSNDINNIYYTVTKTKNGVSETLSDTFQFNTSSFQFTGTPTISQKFVSYNVPALYLSYAIMNTPPDFTGNINDTYLLDAFKSQVSVLEKAKYLLSFNVKKVIGSCAFKKELIIFAKDSNNFDEIIKYKNIENGENSEYVILYSGDLNFNINNPIKTYVSYENEKNIKVYWIDGLNQPRVINIADGVTYETRDTDDDNHFNFCTPIYNNETIQIEKKAIGGFFHSGIIQYFMTYVDQNDQESKTFYQSPLYYITDNDRALSPEENSTNSFEIKITNINNNVLLRKKLRVYSLQRTSLDAVPVTRLVYELKLAQDTGDLTITDTGNVGMNIDPQILLMLGCDEFVPKTIGVKDNTLFFGNIKTNTAGQESTINEILNFKKNVNISTNSTHLKAIKKRNEGVEEVWKVNIKEFQLNGTEVGSRNEVDIWNKNGSDNEIKGFMYQEEYMLGVQLLHKSGEWSEPIWVCDKIMSQPPVTNPYHEVPYFYTEYDNDNDEINDLIDNGYIAIRPLVVCNDLSVSRVLCCGVLNPILKYKDTLLSSWFFRPVKMNSTYIAEFNDPTLKDNSFSYINALGNDDGSISIVTEIQPVSGDSYLASTEVDSSKASDFKIMGTWRTFNSPELEFEKINKINNNYTFYACADVQIHHLKYDIEMFTATSTETLSEECGFKKKFGTINYMSGTAKSSMTFVGGKEIWIDKHNNTPINTQIFPWHNDVSYSGDLNIDGHHKGSDLVYGAPEKKTITNWRVSQHPVFKSIPIEISIKNISVVNEDSIFINGINYSKNVDILVIGGQSDVGNVRIQYKSTPHAVINFNYYSENGYTTSTNYASLTYGYLLNKDYDTNPDNHFKGRFNGEPTDTSMYENTWYIAGDTIKLIKDEDVTVRWTKGDTYYQRYNCLKTYPFSHEAKNSVIDILSFMVQTRINIDGTYDKQKTDILHIEPQNFNRLNDVYSQMDNFFTYHKLDPDRFQNTFPNLVTWSKQKVFGESIDFWTNIRLTNVLDLDGSLGEITALKLWNNKLIAFQQKGIALIKYNENVMIPQTTGAPIVLMNSGLVSGKEYITNQFGCQNEWSIVNAKSGLYFSDDYNHKLYVLSDGIKCISDELGFKSYLKNKNYSGVWTPNRNAWTEQNGGTLRTYYDQQLGDIYFIDGKDCLTYNETANLFTSFYDYVDVNNDKRVFDFINIENKNYWILNNFANNGNPLFYEHRAIDNLNIFDNNKGYEVEITANVDPHIDKIFDTVEIRGDAYTPNLNSGYGALLPFDTLQVSNEYQDTNEQSLTFLKDKPYSSGSNMKQKYRIWRAAIGRDALNVRAHKDRIRNYWSRIKLKRTATNNLRAKIHDIIVNVYE